MANYIQTTDTYIDDLHLINNILINQLNKNTYYHN